MARIIVTGRMETRFDTQYVTDYLAQKSITTRMVVPKHLENASDAELAAILQAGGSTVKAVNGVEQEPTFQDLVCRDSNQITPRGIRLIYENGSTMRVPIRENNNGGTPIADRAQTIVNASNNISGASPVICVQLVGERAFGIQSDFPADEGTQNTPVPAVVASNYYSGTAQYQTDVGETLALPFKVLSELDDAPPSAIGAAWQECVGELSNSGNFSCGAVTDRYTHRRFIADFLTTSLFGGDGVISAASHEIPVLELSDVITCGVSIRDTLQGALFCLTYEGESDNRFDRVNGINLG